MSKVYMSELNFSLSRTIGHKCIGNKCIQTSDCRLIEFMGVCFINIQS